MIIKRVYHKIKNIGRPKTIIVPIIKPVDSNKMLDGRCALITGGSSGIGLAIAKSYLEAGCKVIICGSSLIKLEKAIKEIDSENAKGLQLDVRCVSDIKVKLEEARLLFPNQKIDILVNSAGLTQRGDIWDITEDLFDSIMDVNVKGVFFMSKAIAEYWISEGIKGNILNISSSSSLKPAWGPYQMSKWAVKGMTTGLASKLCKYNITVNAIAPGKTATPMMGKDSLDDLYCPDQPIGRFEIPQEIGGLAVAMVSWGSQIVGDTVYATGGTGLF